MLTPVQFSGGYGELEQQELSLVVRVQGIPTERVASDQLDSVDQRAYRRSELIIKLFVHISLLP